MTTPLRKTFAGLATAAAVLTMSACGTSKGDVEDKLTDAFKSAGLEDDQAEEIAECMAPKVHDDLSDDGLDKLMDADTDKIASGKKAVDLSEADQKVMDKAAADCVPDIDVSNGGK